MPIKLIQIFVYNSHKNPFHNYVITLKHIMGIFSILELIPLIAYPYSLTIRVFARTTFFLLKFSSLQFLYDLYIRRSITSK